MKRLFSAVFAATLVIAFSAPAIAGQTYSNGQFSYSCTYPDGWKMKEESAAAELGAAEAAMAKSMGISMPAMASVCFAEKKCDPASEGAGPEIRLTMMELQKQGMTQPPRGGPSAAGNDRGERGGKGKEECEVIENGKRTWAGKSAQFITTRCPEKKKWRYTTSLTLNRDGGKAASIYTLMCTMRPESEDKAESLNQFQSTMKPQCDANVASAKILK